MLKLKSIDELRNSGNTMFTNGPVDINNFAELWAYYEVMRDVAGVSRDEIAGYQTQIRMEAAASGLSYVYDVLRPGLRIAKKLHDTIFTKNSQVA